MKTDALQQGLIAIYWMYFRMTLSVFNIRFLLSSCVLAGSMPQATSEISPYLNLNAGFPTDCVERKVQPL